VTFGPGVSHTANFDLTQTGPDNNHLYVGQGVEGSNGVGVGGQYPKRLERYAAASYSVVMRGLALLVRISQQPSLQPSQQASAADPLPEQQTAAAAAAAVRPQPVATEPAGPSTADAPAAPAGAAAAAAVTRASTQSQDSPGVLRHALLSSALLSRQHSLTQCDSKDTFHIPSSVLSPAPTAATPSSSSSCSHGHKAGSPCIQSRPSNAPSAALAASTPGSGENSTGATSRCNSLPSLPTSGLGPIDSVDSFACPATTLSFMLPVGARSAGSGSRSMYRSSSCSDPAAAAGAAAAAAAAAGVPEAGPSCRTGSYLKHNPSSSFAGSSSGSSSGSSGTSSGQQQQQWVGRGEGGQLASRSSAVLGSISVPFKRHSRGSNSGAVDLYDPVVGATGSGVAFRARTSSSSSQVALSTGPSSPSAPSNTPSGIVKATSPEDKQAARAYRAQVQAQGRSSIAAPARLSPARTLSPGFTAAEVASATTAAAAAAGAGPSVAAVAAAPVTVFSIESAAVAAAAAQQPLTQAAEAAAAAVRTAVAAVPAVVAAVVAAVRQATSTKVGRRAVMLLSMLLLGGLWALVANVPTSG
jgi:hypothetical protein